MNRERSTLAVLVFKQFGPYWASEPDETDSTSDLDVVTQIIPLENMTAKQESFVEIIETLTPPAASSPALTPNSSLSNDMVIDIALNIFRSKEDTEKLKEILKIITPHNTTSKILRIDKDSPTLTSPTLSSKVAYSADDSDVDKHPKVKKCKTQ